ncbi:MAG TPA: hypothetical protein VMJ14_00025 [Burkholderiales bacterium]|nr:hypothetical protein [Burkholderiales bacterium]
MQDQRRTGSALAAVASLLAFAPPARAAEDAWRYELTPYLWATAIRSETQNGNGPTVRTDMSPLDLLKNVDAGLMGTFEASKDRWSILLDGIYAKVGPSATITNTVAGVPLSTTGNATITTSTVAGALGYRAVEGTTPVDVLFGARYNRIDVKADATLSLIGLPLLTRSVEFRRDWTDPYVGARVTRPLAEHWTAVGYLDAGGFGIGSKNTWQALAGLNYAVSDRFTAKFGYRYLHTNYDDNGFRYKSDLRGVFAGAGIGF